MRGGEHVLFVIGAGYLVSMSQWASEQRAFAIETVVQGK